MGAMDKNWNFDRHRYCDSTGDSEGVRSCRSQGEPSQILYILSGTQVLALQHPMPVPNPEQTSSLFSLGVFFFLDPVVFEACRVPHLPYDRLPPLADTDTAKNLKVAYFRVSFPLWLRWQLRLTSKTSAS